MDIDTLLPALQQHDKQAFASLVRAYHRKLLALASSIVGQAQAEEVLQEAWISAWRALPKFEGRSSLKTWLTRIVINAANSRHRQNKPELSLDAAVEDNPGFWERFHPADGHWSKMPGDWGNENPDQLLEQGELGRCLEKTLNKLPDLQQTVFVLRHVQDLELDEICNVLDISSSNVRVLLHRARLKLFQTVEHFQETGEC
ncbi:RNA polymerase sigma factor [Permianibacter aggregans]|uniref:RNA polymerase sigma-70 factor (ECF subfamily) n=1 Tax=Permianibacter aggregans TaxID=1510150 RepID=A0A4R6UWL2_9GAMM|nr:RNA polymerase sigma factor [Permianibacter aggregans]QGX39351.1 RNA polymerase sigma factor [Permianibacter aggregans]TDQ49915.1 RNA polymerase sigma-70 factor (ECF subfamily) [Permianibacter aggregans]